MLGNFVRRRWLQNADDGRTAWVGGRWRWHLGLRLDRHSFLHSLGWLDGEYSLGYSSQGQAADHCPPADCSLWCFQNGTPRCVA